jgi:hypothetical protein
MKRQPLLGPAGAEVRLGAVDAGTSCSTRWRPTDETPELLRWLRSWLQLGHALLQHSFRAGGNAQPFTASPFSVLSWILLP